jgi:hypothetical protein
MLVFLGS